RARRLRRKEIPYIQGEAIKDSSRFFGRRPLMENLRDTIATTSYALVGEFRIGKTSVQHQLTQLLESLQDPSYVFLPIFIDLQHLGLGQDHRFFHFLGEYLLKLAKEHEVPAAVLDKLEHGDVSEAEEYDSLSFCQDLDTLLKYWRKRFAP